MRGYHFWAHCPFKCLTNIKKEVILNVAQDSQDKLKKYRRKPRTSFLPDNTSQVADYKGFLTSDHFPVFHLV